MEKSNLIRNAETAAVAFLVWWAAVSLSMAKWNSIKRLPRPRHKADVVKL